MEPRFAPEAVVQLLSYTGMRNHPVYKGAYDALSPQRIRRIAYTEKPRSWPGSFLSRNERRSEIIECAPDLLLRNQQSTTLCVAGVCG